MISLGQLWIPILASAVGVFVASSLIHMVLKWHNSDYRKIANEDEVRSAIRASGAAPGQYVMPHCAEMKDMQKPEMQEKFKQGPVAFLTLIPPGPPTMGKALGLWFAFTLGVSIALAYLASRTLPQGASFMQVCRLVGIVALLAYAGGSVANGIWMGRPWKSVAKDVADGVIYGLVSAVLFAWLWPR